MKLTVLIADDVADMRFLLRQRLEERGAQVVGEATDAEEAFDLAVRLRPQVVVSDLFVSAIEPAGYVRRFRESLPSACIILMSATPPNAPIVADAVAAGADGYLDKGDGFAAMAARIMELCHSRDVQDG
jgi:DNA-binding NarL/FixJ family response regulator